MRLRTVAALVWLGGAAGCGGADPSPGSEPAVNADTLDAPGRTPADTPARAAAPLAEGWTLAPTAEPRPRAAPGTVVEVRTAEHPGFERVVLEVREARVPGYRVEYLEGPVHQCGSGFPVEVEGAAVLSVRLWPAAAHDDRGRPTVEVRELRPHFPALRELRLVCDFEGQVEWALGVDRSRPYRVMELTDPARLVVDVRR